ncbi:MAG: hypothetical protein IH827_12110, partial [Myxococcales bacterium]|nr:hypothetical protein [Myxococcales bacterium]
MASLKIESLRIDKLVSMFVALAFVFATLLVATQPANANADGGALFRVKQRWWYSQAESWTSGNVQPDDDIETGPGMPGIYKPPGTLRVGVATANYPNNPPFTMP